LADDWCVDALVVNAGAVGTRVIVKGTIRYCAVRSSCVLTLRWNRLNWTSGAYDSRVITIIFKTGSSCGRFTFDIGIHTAQFGITDRCFARRRSTYDRV